MLACRDCRGDIWIRAVARIVFGLRKVVPPVSFVTLQLVCDVVSVNVDAIHLAISQSHVSAPCVASSWDTESVSEFVLATVAYTLSHLAAVPVGFTLSVSLLQLLLLLLSLSL